MLRIQVFGTSQKQIENSLQAEIRNLMLREKVDFAGFEPATLGYVLSCSTNLSEESCRRD